MCIVNGSYWTSQEIKELKQCIANPVDNLLWTFFVILPASLRINLKLIVDLITSLSKFMKANAV